MKKYNLLILFLIVFQQCRSQNIKNNDFIYHSADYYLGHIYEEHIYNSSTGIYEHKEFINNQIVKDIKIFIKYNPKDLENINKIYSSQKLKLSSCYYEDNIIAHKSTITFDNKKDNFNLIICEKNEDILFVKIENEIERYVTSSEIYKNTFYWKFYKK